MAQLAFFGTPEFAIPTFLALHEMAQRKGHGICFVVTKPDRKRDRHQKIHEPLVKTYAEKLGIPVIQPETLKKESSSGESLWQTMSDASLDLAVVVAYGRLIPKRMLSLPRCGFVNVHASLLPRWRGAAPVQRALEASDSVTGVSIMDMVLELDAGDVYRTKSIPICGLDTGETLSKRLAFLGARLLIENLEGILDGRLAKKPQASLGTTYAPMLLKSEGLMSFSKTTREILNHGRAMHPWPGSYAFHKNMRIRFFSGFGLSDVKSQQDLKKWQPGQVVSASDFLGIRTCDGAVYFSHLQLEGRRVMPAKEALRGYSIKSGDYFQGA